jgi:hypothetical protein
MTSSAALRSTESAQVQALTEMQALMLDEQINTLATSCASNTKYAHLIRALCDEIHHCRVSTLSQ